MKQLTDKITAITEELGGTWGIVLEDLDTNKTWSVNEDEMFYAASVIKVPIMAAAFAAQAEGVFNLSDQIEVKKEELVGGSGVLQALTPGIHLPIRDILTLMIIQSDNTATNLMIDLVGAERIQELMKKIGMENSTFYNKLMIVPTERNGSNRITARDIGTLLKAIVTGKVVSLHDCVQMIEIMKQQQIREGFQRRLPYNDSPIIGSLPEWKVANKTGWVPGTRHDVSVFYVGKRKLIATVLSKDVDDLKSLDGLADIGEAIYLYLIRND